MEYEIGKSYIINPRKEWICESCQELLPIRIPLFMRTFPHPVEENYKIYKRFHIDCAKQLKDLNLQEKELLNKQKECKQCEKGLRIQVHNILKKFERKNKLTYLSVITGQFKNKDKIINVGKKGCSDFIIFFNEGKTVFIELKTKTDLNSNQKQFKDLIEKLNYKYLIIKSISELYYLLEEYIDLSEQTLERFNQLEDVKV